MTRGFAIIALDNPKRPENIGGALRAAFVYSAEAVVVSGHRVPVSLGIKHCTNTFKAWRHIPTFQTQDVFDCLPYDCTPVAVDLLPDAIPLNRFVHPARAFYVFGAEDATLGKRIVDRCRYSVVVPTRRCMNLAATVNVVLYDRLSKELNNVALQETR